MSEEATRQGNWQTSNFVAASVLIGGRHRARANSAAATHQGLRRTINQDAFLDRPDIALWAVADGVGGLAAGEKASRAVIDALAAIDGGDDIAEKIVISLHRANYDLRLEALIGDQGIAASTVVVFATDKAQRNFTCLWVGDSRLYRLRAGVLEQITRDHTPQAQFRNAGHSGLPAAPPANALSRAIGSEENLDVEEVSGAIKPGDLFLLCTDGLSKPVAANHIGRLLATDETASVPENLIDAALNAGGPDNVTAVVVAFPGKSRSKGKRGSTPQASLNTGGRRWLSKYVFLSIGSAALALSTVLAPAPTGVESFDATHALIAGNLVLQILAVFGETLSYSPLRRIARGLVAVIGTAIPAFGLVQWLGLTAPQAFASIEGLFAY